MEQVKKALREERVSYSCTAREAHNKLYSSLLLSPSFTLDERVIWCWYGMYCVSY